MKKRSLSHKWLALLLVVALLATQFGLLAVFADNIKDPVYSGYESVKFDPPPPQNGTEVTETIPGYGTITAWIKHDGPNGTEVLYWKSSLNFGISYVYVKGSNGGTTIPYNPPSTSGFGASPVNASKYPADVSHVTFYFKQPTTGRVSVKKILNGAETNEDQVFTVTLQDGNANKHEIELAGGETKILNGLDFGDYVVTEATVEGFTNVGINPSSFTLSALNSIDPLLIEVTNEKDPLGSIKVYKTLWNGAPAQEGVEFKVILKNEAGTEVGTKSVQAGGSVEFTHLVIGEYTVQEVTDPTEFPDGYIFNAIVMGDPGTSTIDESIDGMMEVSVSKENLHPAVTIVNEREDVPDTYSISITKAVIDGPVHENDLFEMTIDSVNDDESSIAANSAETVNPVAEMPQKFSLADGGVKVIENVPPGTYTITEAKTPGYKLVNVVIDDVVNNGVLKDDKLLFSFEVGNSDARQVEIVVNNEKLPPDEPKEGKLIVKKVLENASGDDTSFKIDVLDSTKENIVGSVFLKDGESKEFTLLEGTYYVVEKSQPQDSMYRLISITDNGAAEIEDDKTTNILVTNTKDTPPAQEGSVRVQKLMNDGSTPNRNFTVVLTKGTGNDAVVRKVDVQPGEEIIISDLEPGTYAITEESVNGYELVSINVTGYDLVPTNKSEVVVDAMNSGDQETSESFIQLIVVTNKTTPPPSNPPSSPPNNPPIDPPASPPLEEPSPVVPVVQFAPEPIPEAPPVIVLDAVPEIIETPEKVPLAAPVLPKTAGLPLIFLIGAGVFSMAAGFRLNHKK